MTKRQRMSIYKNMLKDLEETPKYWWNRSYRGFCSALHAVSFNIYLNDLPELLAYRPKNKANNVYWWSIKSKSGSNKRINILKKIIELA